LPNFKLYSQIYLPHEWVKSWCRLYTRTRFFSPKILGAPMRQLH